jgi:hypothetical protein
MMWGPGWESPMWAFWWIFPLLALVVFLGMIVMMIRAMRGGTGFMCTGHHAPGADDTAELRREIRELREEVKALKASR